jgi:hypothetical protein
MKYNHKIKQVKKNKYQNFLSLDKEFYSTYLSSRKKMINKLNAIINLEKVFESENLTTINKTKTIHTFNEFFFIFKDLKKKNKLKKKNQNKIYIFYQKFETNLILKDKYDKNFNKISEKETNLSSYILLGFFLKKIKNLNQIQKLNCLIKINDHLIINQFIPKNKEILTIFVKNIEHEIININKLNQK